MAEQPSIIDSADQLQGDEYQYLQAAVSNDMPFEQTQSIMQRYFGIDITESVFNDEIARQSTVAESTAQYSELSAFQVPDLTDVTPLLNPRQAGRVRITAVDHYYNPDTKQIIDFPVQFYSDNPLSLHDVTLRVGEFMPREQMKEQSNLVHYGTEIVTQEPVSPLTSETASFEA